MDLILDWRVLGYGRDEPWEPRSNSAQERFKADAARRAAEYLRNTFALALVGFSTTVRTVSPLRTFWEKATIVHQEVMRPEGKRIPRRYSRHYYDLYRLGNSPVLEQALDDTALLARVVEFKEKFYRTPWARLGEAWPGSLRLVPPEFRIEELKAGYRSMAPCSSGSTRRSRRSYGTWEASRKVSTR